MTERRGSVTVARPAEVGEIHTRVITLGLGLEESRVYWRHGDHGLNPGALATRAFEERWFGVKSLAWLRRMLPLVRFRYDPYPAALGVLRRWRDMDVATRQLVCHWHLQLTDPLYRAFTTAFLDDDNRPPGGLLKREAVQR
jgi:hypothetical protein